MKCWFANPSYHIAAPTNEIHMYEFGTMATLHGVLSCDVQWYLDAAAHVIMCACLCNSATHLQYVAIYSMCNNNTCLLVHMIVHVICCNTAGAIISHAFLCIWLYIYYVSIHARCTKLHVGASEYSSNIWMFFNCMWTLVCVFSCCKCASICTRNQ